MAQSKFLYVLRHAEAKPGIGIKGDFLRELTLEGRKQLDRLLGILNKKDFKIDLVLVSPAIRTLQTSEIIGLGFPSDIRKIVDDIFDAEPQTLLELLNDIKGEIQKVLLIGHNPGISALVAYISGQDYISMKPGMMAIIELQVDDWKMLGGNTGILKEILQ
jgi:phosphohistidine phosphatase